MKVYIVIEDYTAKFCGMYATLKDAKKIEKEIGGSILKYDLNQPTFDLDNEYHAFVPLEKI